MKNKIVILPDLHLQFREPQRSASIEFLKWIDDTGLNNKSNTLIQMGDFYDKYNPEPEVIATAISMFQDSWAETSYVLAGNTAHEYDRNKNMYAISTLNALHNVETITHIKEYELFGISFLFIPWFPDDLYKDDEGNNIKFKDYLNNTLPDLVKGKKYDFVLGHVNATEKIASDYIDLSYINCKNIIMGHIHNTNLGVCIPNARGQDVYNSRVMLIDKETKKIGYISIPKFILYEDIEYPADITCFRNIEDKYKQFCVYTVNDAIDKRETLNYYTEKYKDVYIREVNVKKLNESTELENSEVKEKMKLSDWLDNYCKDNKLDSRVETKLKEMVV